MIERAVCDKGAPSAVVRFAATWYTPAGELRGIERAVVTTFAPFSRKTSTTEAPTPSSLL
jgi:hypothetical protein